MSRSGLRDLGGGHRELGDSHDSVLEASEAASVLSVGVRDELDLGGGTSGMGSLDAALGHGVRDDVEGVVHILVEEGAKLWADKEALRGSVSDDVLPHDLLLAESRELLVVGGIEMASIGHVRALVV